MRLCMRYLTTYNIQIFKYSCDDEVPCCDTSYVEVSLASLLVSEGLVPDEAISVDDDDDIEEPEMALVSGAEAFKALDLVRYYLMQQDMAKQDQLDDVDRLKAHISIMRKSNVFQPSITSYFSVET